MLSRPASVITSKPGQRLANACDANAVAEALIHWPWIERHGYSIKDCGVHRVHQRGNGELNIEYTVRLKQGEQIWSQTVFGELIRHDPHARQKSIAESLKKPRRSQLRYIPIDEAVFVLPYLEMVVRLPGFDERLYGLRLLHDENHTRLCLQQSGLKEATADAMLSTDLLGHRLGKRAVAKIHVEAAGPTPLATHLVMKCYKSRSDLYQRVFHRMQLVHAHFMKYGSDITTPAPLFRIDRLQTILMEHRVAIPLLELPPIELVRGMRQAGVMLRNLSMVQVPDSEWYGPEHELCMLASRVALVSQLYPGLEPLFQAGFDQVKAGLLSLPVVKPASIHRDFYEKQIMISRSGSCLIDFDTLCWGDPALDIGNFIAHIELNRCKGIEIPAEAEESFLSNWADCGSTLERARIWKQATQFRLACLYVLTTRWNHLGPKLVEDLRLNR